MEGRAQDHDEQDRRGDGDDQSQGVVPLWLRGMKPPS